MNDFIKILLYEDDDVMLYRKQHIPPTPPTPPTPPVDEWDMEVTSRYDLSDGWVDSFIFDGVIEKTKIDGKKGYIKFSTQPTTITHNHSSEYYSDITYPDSIEEIIRTISPIKPDNVRLPNNLKRVNTLVFDGTNLINSAVLSNCEFTTPIAKNSVWDAPYTATPTSIVDYMFEGCTVPNINDIASSSKPFGVACFKNSNVNGDITLRAIRIPESAFEGTNITGITVNNNVRYIDAKAFANCINLKSIIFKKSTGGHRVIALGADAFKNTIIEDINTGDWEVQSFGSGSTSSAFANMPKLKSLTINLVYSPVCPSGYWFTNTPIESIVLGNKTTKLPSSISVGVGSVNKLVIPDTIRNMNVSIQNAKNIYVLAVTPPTTTTAIMLNFARNSDAVYVPAESVEAYKTDTYWKRIAAKIQPIV